MRTLLAWLLLTAASVATSAEFGANAGVYFGPKTGQVGSVINSSITTNVMTAANNAWAYRFVADDARDIKKVHVRFTSITSPGTMTARVETIDGTSGKPTGTLYDANATISFTPTTGWNDLEFASIPTTGLTVGTPYAIVLIKNDSGTTCTLTSSVIATEGAYPHCVLTAADGSTRSAFAEVANTVGICYVTLEDDEVDALSACVSGDAAASTAVYGADIVVGLKVVIPVDVVVRAVQFNTNLGLLRIGTPGGDLRMRILDASNASQVAVTVDKELLLAVSGRGLCIPTPLTSLPAGTYRVVFDSASSANSSNCFQPRYATLPNGNLQSPAFCYTESTNASTSFTWTDTPTRQLGFGLLLDSLTGGGGSNVVDPLSGSIPGL